MERLLKHFRINALVLLCLLSISLISCNTYFVMFKNFDKVSYTETPNPMRVEGDSISIKVIINIPPQYFKKKAVETITPILKFTNGKEMELHSLTLVGEKSPVSGIRVTYLLGGRLTYVDKLAYTPEMKGESLFIKTTLLNTKMEFPLIKLADGGGKS